LKLNNDKPLSNVAFNLNLRHYIMVAALSAGYVVEWWGGAG